MRLYFPLFLLLLNLPLLTAQNASVKGVVKDSVSQEGIPFASVALFSAGNDAPVAGVTTSINGEFSLSGIEYGDYNLLISFIGYEQKVLYPISLTRSATSLQLGSVLLSPSTVLLDDVEVTALARTAAASLDRRTYRAADFETARGGTAADVLNRLPSVAVSPDGEVSVRGTSDFMVYLNGRPTQLEPSVLLAQLSASSITSIDIITVPTARYDAQGKGGIINITTKTEGVEGFSVSANGLLGGAPWGHRTDPYSGYNLTDNTYGGGVNLMYGTNGWLFYGGASYSWRDVNSYRSGDVRILDKQSGAYKHMEASGTKPEWEENISFNAGFDANLSSNSKLSASYYYGNRLEGRQANYLYHIVTADKDKNAIDGVDGNEYWIFNPNVGIRTGTFHTLNADFNHKIDDASAISISALYEHSLLAHDIDNPNIFYNPVANALEGHQLHYKQSDATPLDGLRFSVDYARSFDNGHTLNLGLQPQFFAITGGLTYDTLNVASGAWGSYADLENEIDLTRAIYAGFVDYGGAWGELTYKAGVRLEYTDQVLDIANPDYFTLFDRQTNARNIQQQLDWFPSFHASYQLNELDRLILAASRRINRAPIKNMAPFLYRRHLEVYVVGDPELKPEYINTVELSYGKAINRQQLTLTCFYRAVDNAVFRVNTVFPDELVLIRSFTNAGNTTAMGVELNANLELGTKTKLFVGGSVYDYRVQADIFGYQEDNRSLSWSLKGNANWSITRALRFTADFDMQSAQVTSQGRNEMRYIANAAFNYAPSALPAWNFSLRGLNLLNSNIRGLSTRAYDSSGVQIFYQDTEFKWYGPILQLGVSYQLNWKGQAKKAGSEFGKGEF